MNNQQVRTQTEIGHLHIGQIIARMIDESGLTRKAVASELGRSVSMLDKMCEGVRGVPVRVAQQIRILTRSDLHSRWIAELSGGVFVPDLECDGAPINEVLSVAADASRGFGVFLSEVSTDILDGEFSQAECERIVAKSNEALVAILRIKILALHGPKEYRRQPQDRYPAMDVVSHTMNQ